MVIDIVDIEWTKDSLVVVNDAEGAEVQGPLLGCPAYWLEPLVDKEACPGGATLRIE